MSERYLWRFYWDYGRNGEVEGLFVATDEEINKALGMDVYFGEILGKHSEVYGKLEGDDLEKIDLDSETVEKVSKLIGDTWSGYNPLSYLKYKCSKCGDSYHEEEFNIEKGICGYCDV